MGYDIYNGKIETEACEINVAHHCNRSCRSCTHLAPRAKKILVDPGSVLKDLSALAGYYHPKRVSLLGAEPLLHPGMLDVVDAVLEVVLELVVLDEVVLWVEVLVEVVDAVDDVVLCVDVVEAVLDVVDEELDVEEEEVVLPAAP